MLRLPLLLSTVTALTHAAAPVGMCQNFLPPPFCFTTKGCNGWSYTREESAKCPLPACDVNNRTTDEAVLAGFDTLRSETVQSVFGGANLTSRIRLYDRRDMSLIRKFVQKYPADSETKFTIDIEPAFFRRGDGETFESTILAKSVETDFRTWLQENQDVAVYVDKFLVGNEPMTAGAGEIRYEDFAKTVAAIDKELKAPAASKWSHVRLGVGFSMESIMGGNWLKKNESNPFGGADEAYFVEPANKTKSFREWDFGPYRVEQTHLCSTDAAESDRQGRVAIQQGLSKFINGVDSFIVDPAKYRAFHEEHKEDPQTKGWPLCGAKSCRSDAGSAGDCSATDNTMFELLQVLDKIDGFVGIQSYADWQRYQDAGAPVVVDQKALGNGLRYDVLQARAALKALGFDKLADPALGKVMITETGWPTSAPSQGAQQQHNYFKTIIDAAAGKAGDGEKDPLSNVPMFLFMTFDDCNKPGVEAERHFGLLSGSGKFKDGSAGTETVCTTPPPGPLPEPQAKGNCNKNVGAIKDPDTKKVEQITCEEAFHRTWLQYSKIAPLKGLPDSGKLFLFTRALTANWVASRTASLLPTDGEPLTCECYNMCRPLVSAVQSQNSFASKIANVCASRGFWSEKDKRTITCMEGAVGQLVWNGVGSAENACVAIAKAVPQSCYACGEQEPALPKKPDGSAYSCNDTEWGFYDNVTRSWLHDSCPLEFNKSLFTRKFAPAPLPNPELNAFAEAAMWKNPDPAHSGVTDEYPCIEYNDAICPQYAKPWGALFWRRDYPAECRKAQYWNNDVNGILGIFCWGLYIWF